MISIPLGKTAKNQTVPMISTLKNELQKYKRSEGPIVDSNPDTITHQVKLAMKKAGIVESDAMMRGTQNAPPMRLRPLMKIESIFHTQILT